MLRALVRFAIDKNDNVQYVGVPLKTRADEQAIGGAGPGSGVEEGGPAALPVPVLAPLPVSPRP
ncbi:MAG: hypothetical protein ABW123_29145 [Cystobacter sp.]